MKIDSLQRRKRSEANKKLTKAYNKMQGLIEALDKKDLPSDVLISINKRIGLINSFDGTEKELHKTLKKTYSKTLTFVEEKLKYVTKHHFQKLWMVYGMLAAAVFTSVFSSFEMFGIGSSAGIGFSLGMLIGMMLGAVQDKQARKEGRQLEI